MSAPFSARRSAAPAFAAAILLALGAAAAGLCLGPSQVGVADAWAAFTGGGDETTNAVVREIRLPRVLAGLLVGALLAVAGVLFQAILRNDLAETYLIGVGPGALLGVTVAAIVAGGRDGSEVPASGTRGLFAFAGAVSIGVVVFLAARRGGRLAAASLLLAGLSVGVFVQAIAVGALYVAVPRWDLVMQWLLGNLVFAETSDALLLGAVLVAGGLVAWAAARSLDALTLGEDAAWLVGVPVRRVILGMGAVGCLMAASAVAVAGLIGFVGLVVPHLGRRLFGPGHRALIPGSALLGAALLVLADALARILAPPREIPPGLLTAVVGAPVLLWLVRRR
jgi:iron complex transport system permease protein